LTLSEFPVGHKEPSPKGLETPSHTHPDSTPSTRFSMKKEPMMMRGRKYSQFHVFPEASLA